MIKPNKGNEPVTTRLGKQAGLRQRTYLCRILVSWKAKQRVMMSGTYGTKSEWMQTGAAADANAQEHGD